MFSSAALLAGVLLVLLSAIPIWVTDTDWVEKVMLTAFYYVYAAFAVLVVGFITGGMFPDHYCTH